MENCNFDSRGVPCTKEESNVSCWGVKEPKGSLTRLYFKFPPLQPNEARIKVLYTGLCHTDCSKIDESWKPSAILPLVPGHEVVAEVEKLGSGVKEFKVGDVVGVGPFRQCCGNCEFCRRGDDQLCVDDPYKETYDPWIGGYSTHMQLRADFIFPLPPKIPKHKAPPVLCAAVTVFSPMRRWGKAGMRCGVIGIGGLGHMALQLSNKMGMHTVAISTSKTKEKEARDLGAKEFICSNDEADMKRIQTKERLDIIVNTANILDLTQYLYALKPGGCFIQIAAPDSDRSIIFDHLNLVINQKIFTGSFVGSRYEVMETLKFCNEFDVCPVVENYKWEELPKAYQRLKEGLPRYRCVVDVASTYDNL